MNLSDRINRVEESLTIGMAKKAREFKSQGNGLTLICGSHVPRSQK
jgi:hypothetical protein